VFLGLGFGYQRFAQDIAGYEGWYLDDQGDVQPQSGNVLAITYKVSYTSVRLLTSFVFDRLRFMEVGLTGDVGVVHVSDEDDHVLRNKLSTADGAGITTGLALELAFFLPVRSGRLRPWIALAGEARRNVANIEQTQYWYDDEPGGDPPAGTRYTGIDHKVDLFQVALLLSLGMDFAK
jgi:hypothetical protein